MDLLKAEIARKRKNLEEKELVGESKKYFKRSELARKEEAEYFERCGYKVFNEKPAGKVIRSLRERGEPIRLFAESDYDAFQRLRKIEFLAPEVNKALGESLGQGDDDKDMDVITKVLKFLLGVWAKDLNGREDHVKRGVQGKLTSATQKQTESYLKPLFRKLRKRGLKRLMTICQKHFSTDPSKCVEYNAL
ncbi:UNVERIFIED_CONTAM: hypothetical protein FKN15_069122 [Acipenser sinensis]